MQAYQGLLVRSALLWRQKGRLAELIRHMPLPLCASQDDFVALVRALETGKEAKEHRTDAAREELYGKVPIVSPTALNHLVLRPAVPSRQFKLFFQCIPTCRHLAAPA